MIYPTVAEADATLSDWKVATGWVGPPDPVVAPPHKKIYAIACASVAPFCDTSTKGVVEAAKAIGWDATYLDGKGTPQGFAEAFSTALAGKPDAIVTMALPESVVGTYIAQAHAQNIKVIGLSSIPESATPANSKYDGYVAGRELLNAELEAYWTIADSNGSAKVGFIWDPAYPFLVSALESAKKIFAQCSGCKVLEVANRQLSVAADPLKYQQFAQSLIQRHPDMGYILMPYGLGTRSIIEAVKTSGKDIKVVNKNSDPVNIALVNQGLLAQENGTSPTMFGWAGLDQTVRVLAGKAPLDDWQENLPLHIYVKANAPAAGEFDWEKTTDFKTHYLKLWKGNA
ncbi:MAG: hypothetical protein NVS3B21_15760 [Acidimicrobiales bacterium]